MGGSRWGDAAIWLPASKRNRWRDGPETSSVGYLRDGRRVRPARLMGDDECGGAFLGDPARTNRLKHRAQDALEIGTRRRGDVEHVTLRACPQGQFHVRKSDGQGAVLTRGLGSGPVVQ